jgi:RimJ/RimL family protein N-acetyltransferase
MTDETPGAIPEESGETLKNGLQVTVRPLRAADREAVARAVQGLDPQSIYTRLFGYRKFSETSLNRIMNVDPAHEVALVVTVGEPPGATVIAGCRLIELPTQDGRRAAEVAFTVEEDFQGQGIASRLLAHLLRIARARGLHDLVADVLVQNASMLRVFERTGLPMRTQREGESVHLTLALDGAD